ncbi:Na(+)/dicarboxylate symporter [Alloiococcus otitis]|nr:Na(+)/dicarboxylate symporter [Alloiococcus otitis]
MVSLFLAFMILFSSLVNSLTSANFLNLPTYTYASLAIFLASIILWLFVAIDWPSLVCLICLGFLPEISYNQVFELSFGNTTFVFLFFTFLVTHALQETHFLNRLTSLAINNKWAQANPWRFTTAFLAISLVIASFISPTILFMIAFPVYEQIVDQFGFNRGDKNASKLLIALFSTIAIGTAMTPINHISALTAMGLYNSAFNVELTNGMYMSFAVPAGLVIFICLYLSLRWVWKLKLSGVYLTSVRLLTNIPKADRKEKWTVSIFALVVILWILPEVLKLFDLQAGLFLSQAGIAFPPLLGSFLLAFIRIEGQSLIHLDQAIRKGVFWPSMLLVAASLALGSIMAMPELGVVSLIEHALAPIIGQLSPLVMVFVFVTWAGLQTNFSSNLVTVSLVTTIILTNARTGEGLPVNTGVIASLIGFMASLAFMTPLSMPYVAIAIGSGWTNAKDCFVYGLWLLLISILSASFVAYPIGSTLLSNLP